MLLRRVWITLENKQSGESALKIYPQPLRQPDHDRLNKNLLKMVREDSARVESSSGGDIWDEKSRTWDSDLPFIEQLNKKNVLELSSRLRSNVQTVICPDNTQHVTTERMNLLELFMKLKTGIMTAEVKKWSLAGAPGLLCLDVEVSFFWKP